MRTDRRTDNGQNQYKKVQPWIRSTGPFGWMTCDFTSLSMVFPSYQDDERLIMKSCGQWNPVNG